MNKLFTQLRRQQWRCDGTVFTTLLNGVGYFLRADGQRMILAAVTPGMVKLATMRHKTELPEFHCHVKDGWLPTIFETVAPGSLIVAALMSAFPEHK
jgi:hypothetical protein